MLSASFLSSQRAPVQCDGSTYCPHTPTDKQLRAIESSSKAWLYGGAAGGGKSDALLMRALRYVHIPGYSALLLRRTFAQLNKQGALLDRAHQWFRGTGAKWRAAESKWIFPCRDEDGNSAGHATIEFGHLQHEGDKYNYQGADYHFIGFDELTQFTETQFRYLRSRLRRGKGSVIPTQLAAGSNPGGVGHKWVKRMFVDAAGSEVQFYPARLEDNPHLDQEDYRESLSGLDEMTRRQLEDGEWVQDTGGLVYKFDANRNVVDELPPGHKWRWALGIDYGWNGVAFTEWAFADTTPIAYVTRSFKRTGMDPEDAAQKTNEWTEHRKRETGHTYERIIGDIGGLGKGYIEYARRRWYIPIEAAQKTDKLGYQKLMNSDLERSLIQVVAPECGDYLEELQELRKAEGKETEPDNCENHCCDAGLYSWRWIRHYHGQEQEKGPEPGSVEALDAEQVARKEKMMMQTLKTAQRKSRRQWKRAGRGR